MLEYDFEASVGYWLCTTWQVYERAVNEELAPQGITFRQSQVLGYLALLGEATQGELVERMRVEPPTLAGILDRMERDGWIRREACAEDRRKKRVFATPAAQPVWSKIVACARRVRKRATQGLSAREAETLRRLLAQVQTNLGAEVPEKQTVKS